MHRGNNSITRLLRWWFYQHGLYCAKHPKVAAVIGITVVMLSSLALFNPRGKPFVFEFQKIMQDFMRFVKHYAMPKWHQIAYLVVILYVAWATDKGVKYSLLKRVRSTLGLNTAAEQAEKRKKKPSWSPPFAARFAIGLCGVLTMLLSIVLACAVANSLLGVSMAPVLDELPLLILYMGPQSVYSLLGASTLTYTQSEYYDGGQVFVVDRVKQIAMATSLTGPEEVLTSLSKAALALTVLWPVASGLGEGMEPVAHLCVHAGLAVLFKCLLQMSVLASVVQALVPFWDPAHKEEREQGLQEVKCRVCLESSPDLRRCPCRCSGSVGYIHPVCFQQWFETRKSLRCELCHTLFTVRMLPSAVTTNMQTLESFLVELLPPLLSRLALYLLLLLALGCNKLGLLLVDAVARRLQSSLGLSADLPLSLMACALLASPAVAAALGVVPEVMAEWHRRHRTMHWDRRSSCGAGSDSGSDAEELELSDRSCPPSPEQLAKPAGGNVLSMASEERGGEERREGGEGGEEERQERDGSEAVPALTAPAEEPARSAEGVRG